LNTGNPEATLYNGTLTFTGSTLSGKSAIYAGGGIANFYGTKTVTGSTLSGNTARSQGAGIWNFLGTVTVSNSTYQEATLLHHAAGQRPLRVCRALGAVARRGV
jgi:hypothetical protein